jgi:hypothetical protein
MCGIFERTLPKLLLDIFEQKCGLEILAIAQDLNFLLWDNAVEILIYNASLVVFISQVFDI